MSGVIALSRLESGWTGLVAVNVGSVQRTITPPVRTSAAAIWADLTAAIPMITLQTIRSYVSTDSKFHLDQGSVAWSLTATGTTETRLGLTGTYSGVTSITSATAVSNLVIPDEMGSAMPPGSWSAGLAAGDGVTGTRPRPTSPGGHVRLYEPTSLATTLALEALVDDGGTYDLFLDGRVITRFRADAVTRRRWGARAALAVLELAGNEVTL